MKRLVKRTAITTETLLPITAGIFIENDEVKFNWQKDSHENDVMYLNEDTSGNFDEDGVRYFYAYTFNTTASGKFKKRIRDYLKGREDPHVIFSENIENFVEQGVFRFDDFCPLNSFTATVDIESTSSHPSLLDVMHGYMFEYTQPHHPMIDFKLIKKTYQEVKFDKDAAYHALIESGVSPAKATNEIQHTVNKFNDLKGSGKLFQMKRFMPREIRSSFYDFLKFQSEEQEELYKLLQGVDVLIYDDFLTSGATIKEVIRYLRAINPNNTLTVFVLVRQ